MHSSPGVRPPGKGHSFAERYRADDAGFGFVDPALIGESRKIQIQYPLQEFNRVTAGANTGTLSNPRLPSLSCARGAVLRSPGGSDDAWNALFGRVDIACLRPDGDGPRMLAARHGIFSLSPVRERYQEVRECRSSTRG